jgi:type I restriction enzyme M protein
MTEQELNRLGKTLWDITDQLRGAMNAAPIRRFSTQCVENLGEVAA